MNLGGFSPFATVQEMYLLNPKFDAVSPEDQWPSCCFYLLTHLYSSAYFPSYLFFKSCLPQLEALDALTLNQIAEIIIEDLPQLPEKKQLIGVVFSDILNSQTTRQQLPQLILLISEMNTVQNFLCYWLGSCVFSTHPDIIWLHCRSLPDISQIYCKFSEMFNAGDLTLMLVRQSENSAV